MLGPFVLREPLGRGGMGEVWAGVHAERNVPVAVKIMAGVPSDAARRQFREEVRAVASLEHPGIVRVIDVGELPRAAMNLGLRPGAPYLVMERAAGTLGRPKHGVQLRAVLLQLLSALAHAHARGVVHLDVKASNVLIGGDRPGVRLSDFGLARTWRDADAQGELRGTPSHMAPEQFDRDAVGPWTDLYALGILAWRLVTGSKPYRATSVLEAARAMARPLPPMVPNVAVPAGFEAWLRALLQKDPARRFRRAADAAHALRGLDLAGWEGEAVGATAVAPDAATLRFDGPMPVQHREVDERALQPMPPPLPPLRTVPWSGADLLGAGVGLFALRDVGVVGREDDQRWLWERLAATVEDGRPRVVALDGGMGSGTSRLARWLSERLHEVGGGELLVARHGPDPERGHGLGPMLAAAFQLAGLPYGEVVPRLEAAGVDPLDAPGLAAVIQPEGARPLHAPGERLRVVEQALRLLGGERPLVLWLDDVEHDVDSLALVRHLGRSEGLRALVVLTRAPAGAVPDADTRRLGPLGDEPMTAIVRRMLGVSAEVEAAVVRRAEGVPLFAIQLLSLLVDTQSLTGSTTGLRATAQALDALPTSLPEAFRARVEAIAPGAVPALQLAALLGHQVPADEWELGLRALELPLTEGEREALLHAGLLRSVDQGFAFLHEAMRDGLALPEAQRLRWHRVLAGIVDDPERKAHHHLQGGQPDLAVAPLGQAAVSHTQGGASGRAEALWRRKLQALDLAGTPPDAPERGETMLHIARSLRVRGAWDEARAAAGELLGSARAHGWERQVANALVELAMDRQNAGDLRTARGHLREAHAGSLPNTGSRAASALRLALLAIDAGDAAEARSMADETLAIYGAGTVEATWNGDIAAGYAHVVLGRLALREGAHETGLDHLDRATGHFARAGDRLASADALNYRAGALITVGRLRDAEQAFRGALSHYEAMRAWSAVLVRVNLAVVTLEDGRPGEARPALEAALVQMVSEGRQAFAAAVRVFLLPCLLHDGERERFEAEAASAREALEATGFVDPDIARIAARTMEGAEGRGWGVAALRALVEGQRARR